MLLMLKLWVVGYNTPMFKESTLDFLLEDPTLAKTVIRGLEKEVVRLRSTLAKGAGFDGRTDVLEEVEQWLVEKEAENQQLKRKLYGRSSEKQTTENAEPADEVTQESVKARRTRIKPENSGRGEVGKDLPEHEELFQLSPHPTCDCVMQSPLKKVKKTEVSTLVDYIPARLIRRKIIRQKYRAKQCGCRLTAPGPTTLVDGGQYGIDFATEIVVRKYQDQLPWTRQVRAFARDGLKVSATTLWNQTCHVANLMEPVYEALRRDIESGFHRHADETRWQVIEDVENQRQQAWLFRNQHHAYFTIEDSRGGEIPLRVMHGAAGALVADDYGGYNKLVKENELLRVQCWAHTRRKFFEIRTLYPEVESFLELVKTLYEKDRDFREEGEQSAARRKTLCGPPIDALDKWRKAQRCLPKSPLGGALAYMNDNWDGLTLFLDYPELPLDNNPAERALRQLVLGRKNFLFNRSMRGAKVAAILYSICVSCMLSGADPKRYLKETILRIRNCRGFQLPYDFVNQHERIPLL